MINKNNQGFTLIETLISILLLSIILFAGMAFYFNGDEFMTKAMHRKMAQEMANSKMEDLKRAGYANLPASGTSVVDATVKVGGLSATRTTTVTNKDDPSGGNPIDYKEVKVRVDWNEAGKVTASPQSFSITTFMAL